MTDLELYFANSTLVMQIISASIALAGVVVSGTFAALTYRVTRIANDASERAVKAADGPAPTGRAYHVAGTLSGEGTLSATGIAGPAATPDSAVSWSCRPTTGEDWRLSNTGAGEALVVEVTGLTSMDTGRILPSWERTDDPTGHSIGPGAFLPFQFARRFGASGPGTLVVSWREPSDPDDSTRRSLRFPLQ